MKKNGRRRAQYSKATPEETIRETLRLLRLNGDIIELGSYVDQVYSYETDDGWQYHWSIAEVKRRAEARGELTTISLRETGMTLATVRLMNQGLDETYAMTTNLLKPILFVPFCPETHFGTINTTKGTEAVSKVHVLVDGWHRVFKALVVGVDILPCYVLTEEDAQASLIIRLPPGQGLPFDDDFATIVVEEETGGSTNAS